MSTYVAEYQNGFAGKKINPAPALVPPAAPAIRPPQRFACNSEARKRQAEQAAQQ